MAHDNSSRTSNRPDGVTLANRLQLAQDIARLIRARLPLDQALRNLAGETSGQLSQATQRIANKLEQGHSLKDSLAPGSSLAARMLAAHIELGQLAGTTDAAIERWVSYLTNRQRFIRRLATALVYPGLLVCVALTSILFSAWYLLPQYQEAFTQLAEVRPTWLDWLGFIHRYFWQLSSATILCLVALVWWISRRRRGVDRLGVPRNQAFRQLLYSQVAHLSIMGIQSGQPVSSWLPLLLEGAGMSPSSTNLDTTPRWSKQLGKETCGVLNALTAGQLNVATAESLLATIGQNAAELSELTIEKEVQWLPMLTSLCVGLVTAITYVGLIYLPWVALFYEIANSQ